MTLTWKKTVSKRGQMHPTLPTINLDIRDRFKTFFASSPMMIGYITLVTLMICYTLGYVLEIP